MAATSSLVFARCYPPRPLKPDMLEALLVRLASDPTSAVVVFEARSAPTGEHGASEVSYWLGAPDKHLRWLRRTCHDLLPGLLIDSTPETPRYPVQVAARVQVKPPGLALSTDRPEAVSRAILSALNQSLVEGEQLVVQVLLGPRRGPRHPRRPLPDPTQGLWSLTTGGVHEAAPAVLKQHQLRQAQAGFAACIRIGATATSRERAGRLFNGLLGGLSTSKAPNTFLRLVRESPNRLHEARAPWRWEFAPAAAELTGLVAWPLGDQDLPGLPPIHPRALPPSPALQAAIESERVLGISNMPGRRIPIGLAAADSLFHLITTGPTGSGKSTALLHLIAADIRAGRPVIVVDPKRQLIDDIIERAVPAERVQDLVIIDPSEEQVPGLNPLDVGDRDPDVVVDGLLAVFAAVFHDGWGPRTQDILHSGLLTLARVGALGRTQQPFTLLDLPRLFVDAPFRRSVIGHVATDPGLGQFWAWYDAQSPQAQAAAIAAPMNKLRQYLLRPSLRRILGQAEPAFRLRDVFTSNKIVLVPLNESLIGPLTAQLLGGLIVAETWAATLERASEHQPTKRPASVWIDEVQNYLHLPTSIDAALNASRSMGVAWNLAHQYRAQLPPAMAAAVDSNARNKLVFRPNDPKDATAYARQTPDLEDIDFLTLPQYTAYATLVSSGASQPWCSLRTQPPPPPTGLGDQVRTASRAHYGQLPDPPHADGPADLAGASAPDRGRDQTDTGPIGRKRRQP